MLTKFLTNYEVKQYKIINTNEYNITNNLLNVFPIYVINLLEDKIRRNYIIKLFKKHKINYMLIIVKKFNYSSLEEKKQIKTDTSKLGCILSHLWCINNAITNNYDRFIIFEDDIMFHKNFAQLFEKVIKNTEIDLLMLGSLDNNIKSHLKGFNNDELIYYPTKNVFGAHANIYRLNFAKEFFNYKMNSTKVLEFDFDYHLFMEKYKIGVCMPNLLVCELSTTNINHYFSPLSVNGFKRYKVFFTSTFTYNDYEYILFVLIQFIQEQIDNGEKYDSFEEMVLSFSKKNTNCHMGYVTQCIINSGYNKEDILEIIDSIKKDTY